MDYGLQTTTCRCSLGQKCQVYIVVCAVPAIRINYIYGSRLQGEVVQLL